MYVVDRSFVCSNGAWFCVGERGGGGHIVLIEMQCY